MTKTRKVKRDGLVVEERFILVSAALVLVGLLLLIRLWQLQIYRMEYYQDVAERNRIRRFELPAPEVSCTIATEKSFWAMLLTMI